MWPNPNEVAAAARKFNTIMDLDMIALEVTRTHRPKSKLLNKRATSSRSLVYKREGSDTSTHRYFGSEMNLDVAREIARDNSGYRWIQQEYVRPLHILGELRVYVVGGKFHSFVATSWSSARNGWEIAVRKDLGTLTWLK